MQPEVALERNFTESTRPQTPIDPSTPPIVIDTFSGPRRGSTVEVRNPTEITEQNNAPVIRADPSTVSDRPRRIRKAPDRLNL